jgi:hypothetical protein
LLRRVTLSAISSSSVTVLGLVAYYGLSLLFGLPDSRRPMEAHRKICFLYQLYYVLYTFHTVSLPSSNRCSGQRLDMVNKQGSGRNLSYE